MLMSSCTPWSYSVALRERANLASSTGDHEKARELADRARRWRDALYGEDNPEWGRSRIQQTSLAISAGDFEHAAQLIEEMAANSQLLTNDAEFASSLTQFRARMAAERRDWGAMTVFIEATETLCPAIKNKWDRYRCFTSARAAAFENPCRAGNYELASKAAPPYYLNMAKRPDLYHYYSLAQFEFAFGQYQQALVWTAEGRELWEQKQVSNDFDQAASLATEVQYPTDNVSIAFLERAGHFFTKTPPALELEIVVLERLGQFEAAQAAQLRLQQLWDRPDDGEANLTAAIELRRQFGDRLHCDAVAARADYRRHKQRWAEAADDYDEILPTCRRAWHVTSRHLYTLEWTREMLSVLSNAAAVQLQLGNFDEARELYVELGSRATALQVPMRREMLDAEAGQALVHEARGEFRQAAQTWQRLVTQTTKIRGTDHPDRAWALWQQARALELHLGRQSDQQNEMPTGDITAPLSRPDQSAIAPTAEHLRAQALSIWERARRGQRAESTPDPRPNYLQQPPTPFASRPPSN